MTEEEKIVESLLEEYPIHELVKFSELDITQKLEENSFMVVKYKELYYKELSVLEDLESKYDKLVGMRYPLYELLNDGAMKSTTKAEISKEDSEFQVDEKYR